MPTAASTKPRKTRTVKATTAAKKANRRTRDAPTTARVDASRLDTDGVLVVCVDDVLTKNERHRLIVINMGKNKKRAGTKESDLAVAFKEAIRSAAEAAGFILGARTIAAGTWSLEVLSIWPDKRNSLPACGFTVANGDSDSSLPMVRDAMQHAGIIDDDMRIVANVARSHYLKGQRRTVAVLTRVDPTEHATSIARMLAIEESALTC